MSRSATLREHVRTHAENRPGVYRFHDASGDLLYVGKSVRVRARMLSYFRAAAGEKAAELVGEADQADWEYVPDEFGALIREMRLIHRHRPRYNVQHKRRRPFVFLKITVADSAPRIVTARRVIEDGSLYFGPFGRVAAVAAVARELASVLGLRDCRKTIPVYWSDQLEMFRQDRSPACIRAELGTCLAPCCGRADAATYKEQVRSARLFLQGTSDEPLTRVEQAMQDAAERLDFEYAARLRDRRDRLSYLRDELAAFRGEVDALSFVYRVPGYQGKERLYLIRGGRVREEIDPPDGPERDEHIRRRIEGVFGEADRGLRAMRADEAAEVLLVAAWFRARPQEMKRTQRAREWLGEDVASRAASIDPTRPRAHFRSDLRSESAGHLGS